MKHKNMLIFFKLKVTCRVFDRQECHSNVVNEVLKWVSALFVFCAQMWMHAIHNQQLEEMRQQWQ